MNEGDLNKERSVPKDDSTQNKYVQSAIKEDIGLEYKNRGSGAQESREGQ